MFKKILIANRGEIACRIIKTAKKMGINTVAIYSTADAHAQHIKLAEEAYCVGNAPAAESYLKQHKIIEIAKETGAEAIHPGYGFLSENTGFADLCQQNNIVFIGPSADAINKMGDKAQAKKIMQAHQVPTTPGYDGDEQSVTILQKEADRIGYPVLIKASAGGGGKGMRLVDNKKDFESALNAAKREAKASFSNDHVILEKYCSPARHVEVQVFADNKGNCIYLFDRDCSVQRRHQKIIEEAPAPNIPDEVRKKMGKAAVNAAKAIQYSGAGTVEFLLLENNEFYFMEMNTRLQVEHPVTEMITGVDLVEWQIKIAFGETLPLKQNELTIKGHAIEARICAEMPDDNFKPCIGELTYFITPTENESIRIDTGVTQRDRISPYYDSMIAKVIAHGHDRETAIAALKQALSDTLIIGVDTNTQYCHRVLSTIDFHNAVLSTQFIGDHQKELAQNETGHNSVALQIAACAEYHFQQCKTKKAATKNADKHSPWFYADNFRLNGSTDQRIQLWNKGEQAKLNIKEKNKTYQIHYELNDYQLEIDWLDDYAFTANINKAVIHGHALRYDHAWNLFYQGQLTTLSLKNPSQQNELADHAGAACKSPMPGTVIDVFVKPGQSVKAGDRLMIIEAMKMEHTITANTDGTVNDIYFKAGDPISEGAELVSFAEENKVN